MVSKLDFALATVAAFASASVPSARSSASAFERSHPATASRWAADDVTVTVGPPARDADRVAIARFALSRYFASAPLASHACELSARWRMAPGNMKPKNSTSSCCGSVKPENIERMRSETSASDVVSSHPMRPRTKSPRRSSPISSSVLPLPA